MASPSFPQRKSQGAGGMTSSGGMTSVLDGPPPSPMMQGAGTPVPGQQPSVPSFAQMAEPMSLGTPDRALSPELIMGMLQSASAIYGMLDSMAQLVPDLANDFVLQKDLLQRTLGKLVVNGGPGAAPGSVGVNFPGGGFQSGSM